MDAKKILSALDDFEKEKGIPKEIVIEALKEALEKAYKRETDADALCRVEIDPNKGTIEMYNVKNIVEEVEDDVYQVELEDAKKINPKLEIGDVLETPVDPNSLNRMAAMQAKQVLVQKIREFEKQSIYDAYIDKKDDIIVGIVESIEPSPENPNFVLINVGKTNAIMKRNHMLPGEKFKIGQAIRVYVVDVDKSALGAAVIVSRTEPGFLKRIFESEIHEVYDGTVEIKGIARKAGERAKVSVTSKNKDVDATGACIGQKGLRIQKISNQVMGEKIDVIEYYEDPVLYIAEALRPAEVVGVDVSDEDKFAIAVVKDEDFSLAIGKRGLNVSLAVKLTGYKIDVITLSNAVEDNIEYQSVEEARLNYQRAKLEKEEELRVAKEKELEKKNAAKMAKLAEEVAKKEESKKVTKEKVAKVEKETKAKKAVSLEAKIKEVTKPATPYTSKDKDDILKKVFADKKPVEKKTYEKKAKKEEDKDFKRSVLSAEELEDIKKKHEEARSYMPVYTEEELKELEEEKHEDTNAYDDFYDDVDYDEFDEYYDEE